MNRSQLVEVVGLDEIEDPEECDQPLIIQSSSACRDSGGYDGGSTAGCKFKPPEINKCQVYILLLLRINIYTKIESKGGQE